MNTQTAFRRTIDHLLRQKLDKTLDEFVQSERAIGSSYNNISKRLNLITDGVIHVDQSTLYRWYEQTEQQDRQAV